MGLALNFYYTFSVDESYESQGDRGVDCDAAARGTERDQAEGEREGREKKSE